MRPASDVCGGGRGESDGVKWAGGEVEAFGRTKRGSGLVGFDHLLTTNVDYAVHSTGLSLVVSIAISSPKFKVLSEELVISPVIPVHEIAALGVNT